MGFFYLSLDQCFGYFFVFLVAKPSNPAPNCGVKFDFSLKNHFLKKKNFCCFLQILIFSEKKVTHGVLQLVIPYRIAFMLEFSNIWHVDKLYQTICYISDLITFRSGFLENEDRFCINFFSSCSLPL